jgi:sulfatase modifying factor 1
LSKINIFICYSHENEIWVTEGLDPAKQISNNRCLLKQWQRAFRKLDTEFWFDREKETGLRGGDLWRDRIFAEIDKADIAILLVTLDFVISPFIMDEELPRIMARHRKGELEVVPVLVQPTRLKDLPIGDFLHWTPSSQTPLSEYYDSSENDFNNARIKVLEAIDSKIKSVRTNREIKEKKDRAKEIGHTEPHKSTPAVSRKNPDIRSNQWIRYLSAGVVSVFLILGLVVLNARKIPPMSIKTLPTPVIVTPEGCEEKKSPDTVSIVKAPMPQKSTPVSASLPIPPKVEKSRDDLKLENMVWIEGGSFPMGDTAVEEDEKPVHTVTVDGFYMDKYEVTQAEYTRVMGDNPSEFQNCPTCPVEKVSWDDAQAYCKKVHKRLPTEAEWEYAACAGSITRYYWGNSFDGAQGWYSSNSGDKTHPVGQKKPNAWGLFDMSGNVWEWCSDWYDGSYYKNSPLQNPQGPSSGSYRVLRGGSWKDGGGGLRSAKRSRDDPGDRDGGIGFRCVCSRD